MARLRAPGGCPWDREQTHCTLRTYLIEEAYEVLDALDSADDVKFAEELGDLLLQVLFHSQIASEQKRFSIPDVIREIHEKMIRRHPHVFGSTRAKTAADVLRNWEIIKREERESKRNMLTPASSRQSAAASLQTGEGKSSTSILDGVPRTLPALLEAYQLTQKAARIGFDWDHVDAIFAKLQEESSELRQALVAQRPAALFPESKQIANEEVKEAKEVKAKSGASKSFTSSTSFVEDEVGDLLFVAVNLARFLQIDPEIALKKTNSKFSRRFRTMERLAREQGTTLAQVPRPQLESLWDQAKLLERS
jgi:MazG family protein